MIEFSFLFLWTVAFILLLFLVVKPSRGSRRVYLLILMNMAYLSGIFLFFPLLLSFIGKR